jgi:hypothetical protein
MHLEQLLDTRYASDSALLQSMQWCSWPHFPDKVRGFLTRCCPWPCPWVCPWPHRQPWNQRCHLHGSDRPRLLVLAPSCRTLSVLCACHQPCGCLLLNHHLPSHLLLCSAPRLPPGIPHFFCKCENAKMSLAAIACALSRAATGAARPGGALKLLLLASAALETSMGTGTSMSPAAWAAMGERRLNAASCAFESIKFTNTTSGFAVAILSCSFFSVRPLGIFVETLCRHQHAIYPLPMSKHSQLQGEESAWEMGDVPALPD